MARLPLQGHAGRALRVGAMTAAIGGLGWAVFALTLPDAPAVNPEEEMPSAIREAGYEIHRQLAYSVPGLELRVVAGRAELLLPLASLKRDETIEAWYAALAASVDAVPGLRIEAELPLDFDPTDRARAMSLIASPALAAGLPREAITFVDQRPPRPSATDRGIRISIALPGA